MAAAREEEDMEVDDPPQEGTFKFIILIDSIWVLSRS